MAEKWSALRANPSRFEFMTNDRGPKCPHCGDLVDIQEHELWQLYDDQDQDIDCPNCDQSFHVQVHVSYSYSTDDQPDMDDDDDEAEAAAEGGDGG